MKVVHCTIQESAYSERYIKKCCEGFPVEELERINRLKNTSDKLLSATGMAIVKNQLGNIDNWKRTTYNKPYVEGVEFNFSISHSGNKVVVAFSKKTIGIDIEEIKPVSLSDFTPVMREEELNSFTDLSAFYRLWAQKEAVIKAEGLGFSMDAKTLIVENDTCFVAPKKWLLKEIKIADDYSCWGAMEEDETIEVKYLESSSI
jgi:4'-phosphopantetheinyl transferase